MRLGFPGCGGNGATALSLVAAVAVAFPACGGDNGDEDGTAETTTPPVIGGATVAPEPTEGGEDEAKIRLAIEAALASAEAERACGPFVTDRYISEIYGTRAGCVDSKIAGSVARSVAVRNIRVKAFRATAVAVPAGGPSSGDRLGVSLIKKFKLWKVDSLRSNVPVGP